MTAQTPRIARTHTIVSERDDAGAVVRTEVIGAGAEIPDWASEVGEHAVLGPGATTLPDDVARPEPPEVWAYAPGEDEEATSGG